MRFRAGRRAFVGACSALVVAFAMGLPWGFAGAESESTDAGGELKGRLRGTDGEFVRVVFRYHRSQVGHGRIRVRLGSEGERFVGDYALIDPRANVATMRRFFVGWTAREFDDLSVGPLGSPWVRETYTFDVFRERLRGEVVATLIGDAGGRMRCRFELEAPKVGLAGGARGACQTESGDVIELTPPPT